MVSQSFEPEAYDMVFQRESFGFGCCLEVERPVALRFPSLRRRRTYCGLGTQATFGDRVRRIFVYNTH